ncbi:DUF7662 domain-containing protein [Sandarakinorhabdus rubra]|uniref:DUF7662 domain-containing protein n=1 Tax=Sandarakinorhabdus rubra TaxID=2672568 RepID=UPI0013DA8B47|nr:hypothetical protein [Sandarakinorhabdus rubra]
MSKYEPLARHLARLQLQSWRASFDEIERVLNFSLPESARKYNAWWANQSGPGHSQTAGWIDAGWKTSDLDLAAEKVTFSRDAGVSDSPPIPPKQTIPSAAVPPSGGMSIAQAKDALSIYYDTDVANIEIIIRG